MRNILTIARREIFSFFVSPVAYFVFTGFVLLAGYFFFSMLYYFNLVIAQVNQMPYRDPNNMPSLNNMVVEPYYGTLLIILVFLIPLLTMRVIAEERKRGTFELLATSPLSILEIVMGKFLGVAFVVFVMMCLVFVFPLLLCLPELFGMGFVGPEIAPVFSGFGAVLLCALGFTSVGMAVSCFTENQIVAGICGMVTLLLLYVIHAPAEAAGGIVGDVLKYLSPVMQSRDLITGVISLKSMVYFLSLIVLGLFLSQRALEAYRWR